MNAETPTGPPGLDRLHDIVLPQDVAWWPVSSGAWLVLAFVLVWIAAAGLLWWRRYRRNAYRRAALRCLEQLRAELRAGATSSAAVGELAELLKRTALAAFPRHDVAMLSGDRWLQFLARTSGLPDFTAAAGRTLVEATFNPSSTRVGPGECERLFGLARKWITAHRVEIAPNPQTSDPRRS